jgi:hypothetical protein
MSEQTNDRREFLKRAGIAGAAIAVGAAVVVGTTQTYSRGQSGGQNGVVVGRSRKNEILYRKTPQWEAFYKAAL